MTDPALLVIFVVLIPLAVFGAINLAIYFIWFRDL